MLQNQYVQCRDPTAVPTSSSPSKCDSTLSRFYPGPPFGEKHVVLRDEEHWLYFNKRGRLLTSTIEFPNIKPSYRVWFYLPLQGYHATSTRRTTSTKGYSKPVIPVQDYLYKATMQPVLDYRFYLLFRQTQWCKSQQLPHMCFRSFSFAYSQRGMSLGFPPALYFYPRHMVGIYFFFSFFKTTGLPSWFWWWSNVWTYYFLGGILFSFINFITNNRFPIQFAQWPTYWHMVGSLRGCVDIPGWTPGFSTASQRTLPFFMCIGAHSRWLWIAKLRRATFFTFPCSSAMTFAAEHQQQ